MTKAQNKELILLCFLVAVGVLTWLSVSTLLPDLAWKSTSVLWSTIVAGFFLAVLWGLSVLLVESNLFIVLAWGLVSFSGVIWFQDALFVLAASVLFVFGVIAYFRTRSEIQNVFNGAMIRPLRKAVPLMVTFFLLAFSVAAYLVTPPEKLAIKNIIPESYFRAVLEYSKPAIQKIDPTFELNEQSSHALYIAGTKQMDIFIANYKKYIPIAYAAGLFLTLRALAPPFYWLAIAVVILLLRFCHRLGIVELRSIPATILTYSFS